MGRGDGDELAVVRADRADALAELTAAENRASRHLTWMALGLSPAALIPFVGLLLEGSTGLIWILLILVFLIEGGRYLLARRDVARLEEVVRGLRGAHDDAAPETQPGADRLQEE